MKPLTRSLLFPVLAFSISAAFTLHAQAPASGDPFVKGSPGSAAPAKDNGTAAPNCLFVMEVYSLDKDEAVKLLDSERGSAARYRRVTDLANAGRARLEILTALATISGQRAVCESTDDVRFVSEFTGGLNKNDAPIPTAWADRAAGDILEIEPVLHPDGRTCDLNFLPQRICLAGFRNIEGIVGDSVVAQPQFDTQTISGCAILTAGEPHYFGSFTPANSHGIANGGAASQVWLAFMHLTVQKPAAEAAKPRAVPADSSSLHIEYTCYSLDRSLARELLVAPASVNAPWESLQALIGEKKARLEHVLTVNTISGQRAKTSETQELRYASVSIERGNASKQNSRRTTTTRPAQEKQDQSSKKATGKGAELAETIETTNTDATSEPPGSRIAFETCNLGVSVTVDSAVRPDGLAVDVSHSLQSVTYAGDLKAAGAGARYPAQPIFEVRKITTSQSIPLGRHVLVGTLNPPVADGVSAPAEADRTWLVFVRAIADEK